MLQWQSRHARVLAILSLYGAVRYGHGHLRLLKASYGIADDFVPPTWVKRIIVEGDAAYGSQENMQMVQQRDAADSTRLWGGDAEILSSRILPDHT